MVERRIMPDELAGFAECFITGTAAEITPVSEIGPYSFTPGTVTKTVLEDYMSAVQPYGDVAFNSAPCCNNGPMMST